MICQSVKLTLKLHLPLKAEFPGPLTDDWKVKEDSSVNFHDKFFLHCLLNFSRKCRKNLSWKFTDEPSITFQSSISEPGGLTATLVLALHFDKSPILSDLKNKIHTTNLKYIDSSF